MGTPFNPTQQTFLLSMLSNLTAFKVGPFPGHQLYASIQQKMALLPGMGSWQVTWGPAIHQPVPIVGTPANAIYVAQNRDDSQMVIAISGTNPLSATALYQDFNVGTTAAWPYGHAPQSAAIASGTMSALRALEGLKPELGLPGAGQTLTSYLSKVLQSAAGSLPVTVTGHSLGGTLSPVVGLWLKDTQGSWDPNTKAQLSVWASAPPTPGNVDFSSYYGDRLGSSTTRYWNSIDVIPHAWGTTTLAAVPLLYAPAIPKSETIDLLVGWAIHHTNGNGYTPVLPNMPAQPGTIATGEIKPGDSAVFNFLMQLFYQHYNAYFDFLGLSQYISILLGSSMTTGREETVRQLEAALRLFTANMTAEAASHAVTLVSTHRKA